MKKQIGIVNDQLLFETAKNVNCEPMHEYLEAGFPHNVKGFANHLPLAIQSGDCPTHVNLPRQPFL